MIYKNQLTHMFDRIVSYVVSYISAKLVLKFSFLLVVYDATKMPPALSGTYNMQQSHCHAKTVTQPSAETNLLACRTRNGVVWESR